MRRPVVRMLRGDAGSAAWELVLVAPVFLLVAGLIVSGARLAGAKGALGATVREAGRTAVEQPGNEAAAVAADRVGREVAAGYGLDASRLDIVPAGDLRAGGVYEVRAEYRVDLPFTFGPLPDSVVVRAQHDEPIDPYRSASSGGGAP